MIYCKLVTLLLIVDQLVGVCRLFFFFLVKFHFKIMDQVKISARGMLALYFSEYAFKNHVSVLGLVGPQLVVYTFHGIEWFEQTSIGKTRLE